MLTVKVYSELPLWQVECNYAETESNTVLLNNISNCQLKRKLVRQKK